MKSTELEKIQQMEKSGSSSETMIAMLLCDIDNLLRAEKME